MKEFSSYEQLEQYDRDFPGQVQKVFSVFSLGPVDLAIGGTDTPSIEFDQSSYFIWLRTTASADLAQAAQVESTRVIPLVTIQLKDGGSEKELFKVPQPIADISGIGQIPFVLPRPYLFIPNSTLDSQLVNYSAIAYDNVRFNLIGYRVYLYGTAPVAE